MREKKLTPVSFQVEEENLFELSVTGLLLISPSGIIMKANKSACQLVGDPACLDGMDIHQLFKYSPAFNLERLISKLREIDGPYEFTSLLGWDEKLSFWANVHFTLLSSGMSEKENLLCQIINISELKQATEDVSNHMHLINELINNIPDNIFIKDTESRFILANLSVSRLMGAFSANEVVRKTDFDFFPKKLALKYRNDELKVMRTGKAQINLTEQVVDTNHNRLWFSTSKIPLRNSSGEIIGIMGIGRNITDLVKEKKALRKAKQAAEKADHLKSAFLANLSHEVRTPLNGILGFSQFLRKSAPEDSKTAHYIDYIIRNGKRLLHLITDIVDLSKIESDQLVLSLKKFSLLDFMNKNERSLHLMLEEEGKKEAIKPLLIMGKGCAEVSLCQDDYRLEQIILALLSNAVKFTEQGSIHLGCFQTADEISFFVRDTGIGIDEKDIPHIFERFTQVDDTIARQYEGAGLGLTLVKELVRLMNGSIKVSSSLRQGSEFSFTISR
ncbi:MAG: PAS domain-containing protein [Bacteroidales bacterium]|nr:PAS domain-containing protein [Bacteroidales bacterium]